MNKAQRDRKKAAQMLDSLVLFMCMCVLLVMGFIAGYAIGYNKSNIEYVNTQNVVIEQNGSVSTNLVLWGNWAVKIGQAWGVNWQGNGLYQLPNQTQAIVALKIQNLIDWLKIHGYNTVEPIVNESYPL